MILLNFIWFLEVALISVIANMMMSAKLATPDLLKKCILKKRLINQFVTVVTLNFGNSSISMTELEFYKNFTGNDQKFEGWPWFKFNNLGCCSPSILNRFTET